jgi:predicted metal-dependent peptidase
VKEDYSEIQKRMDWLFGYMVIQYPFIYQVMSIMIKHVDPKMESMGVAVKNGKLFFYYSPKFFMALKDEEVTYCLFHEILHVVLHHCTYRRLPGKLGNVAADLAINELIEIHKGSCEPPKDFQPLTVDSLKENEKYSDIQHKQTAEWYYKYLLEKGYGDNSGKGNSGKGNSEGGNSEEDNSEGDLFPEFDSHEKWADDEFADEIIRAKVNEINSQNHWGNIGGTLQEIISAAQIRRINWKSLIRQFYGPFISPDRISTRKRPNRRLGFQQPGTKTNTQGKHLVMIDCSGSIDQDLHSQFLGVINQMSEHLTIDMGQFDTEITSQPKPFLQARKTIEVNGRGGTCFQKVIDFTNEHHYLSLVILTDGVADVCTAPLLASVLWVLPNNLKPPVDWGKIINIER